LGSVGFSVIGALALPAAAHADPNSYFLECLTQRGIVITDTAKAVAMGIRIQHDEMNGVPAGTIISNLERYWGADPHMAYANMNCAALTLVSGNS
jgi:hypothetical protein